MEFGKEIVAKMAKGKRERKQILKWNNMLAKNSKNKSNLWDE
jgi:hypothetical protein